MSDLPATISFVAPSGTGKTTFLEKLIPALRDRGVRVMVVKHDVHRFDVDHEGKDTWRFTQAGAHRVLITNRRKLALMGSADGEIPLRELVERHGHGVDLVITEGYRSSSMPKLLVAREGATPRRPWKPGAIEAMDNLVGIVADHPAELPARYSALPRLPLHDPAPCADLILEMLGRHASPRRALTGVLLAGGHSVRMGSDKADLTFGGEPLLPRLIARLQSCSEHVVVVRREGQELPPLPSGVTVVQDLLPDLGPLGGLLTGLAAAPTPFVFLAACDLPLLDPTFVTWLASHPGRHADVILPMRDGHAEPTHAVYGARCLGAIKQAVLSGELGMGTWLGSVRVERVPEDLWRTVHPDGTSFLNVNTPEDLARVEALGSTR
ncbi:MAG: molybdopterin-guanine dinucleotide biosynthesis protein B [Deltaproteobacteria bacterium]|nr:molybdopterin-guanine dinucleotide biosynthesis protein B [Deltaproteobacteria bacterium]